MKKLDFSIKDQNLNYYASVKKSNIRELWIYSEYSL